MNPNDLLEQQQALIDQMPRAQQTNVALLIVSAVISIGVLFLVCRWLYYTVEHFRELAESHQQLVRAMTELSRTFGKHLEATQPKPPSNSPLEKEPQGQTIPPEDPEAVRLNFSK